MSGTSDPDALLMLKVKRGDMRAFEALVDKYKQPVINLAYRTIPDAIEAEDLAQSVFLQVFKSAHRYEASARFSTWLFTIARNLCLNEIRRRSRHVAESMEATFTELEDAPARQYEDLRMTSPKDELIREELYGLVGRAVGDLPENQRTAIQLYQRDEMSYEEIASVLGCSLAATKSLIHRGRETLKGRLKPYLRSGTWQEESPDQATLRPVRL